ncbi:MAG: RagB/SusD family nutrient uptake outer membrane protein, partial [Bacteroidota bacterium]
MKRLSLFGFLIAGLFMSLTNQSCTNLDEEIFSEVLAEDFFQSDEEFISALGSAYTSLYGYADGRLLSVQEVASDAVAVPTRGQDWDDGGHWRRLHQHLYTPDDPEANNAWGFCYGGINACNRLIFQFEQSGNTDAAGFISELKVLRAMYYFWLLDVFGNVPIVDRFDVPADFAPPTTPRADVYAFIESEVLDNIDNLTQTVDGSVYARVHYYVAQALLAKLYINAEVYTGTPQWDKALVAVNEIVNSGIYDLEDNYFDNFKTENDASRENIFVIPYDQVFAGGFNIVARTLHYGSQATFNLTFQPWNGFCTVQEFYNSFDSLTDRRADMFIVGPQFAADGVT